MIIGLGIDVCRIERVGCPAADCFCAAPQYWAYYHGRGGQWQNATTGAAASPS